jgi:hypothetical protein
MGHFHILLRHSNGQFSILPKLVLFVHQRENGVLLGHFKGKLKASFNLPLISLNIKRVNLL